MRVLERTEGPFLARSQPELDPYVTASAVNVK
jgi:hypothetical protein